jgi:hypothetical protein
VQSLVLHVLARVRQMKLGHPNVEHTPGNSFGVASACYFVRDSDDVSILFLKKIPLSVLGGSGLRHPPVVVICWEDDSIMCKSTLDSFWITSG